MPVPPNPPRARVACGGSDGGVVDLGSGEPRRLLAHAQVNAVLTRDGSTYAVAGITSGQLIAMTGSGATTSWPIGAIPCHLAVSPDGRTLVTADYGSSSLSVAQRGADSTLEPPRSLPLDGDGSHVDPERQTRPHPHHVQWIGHQLVVTDLGCDAIRVFADDADAGLVETARCPTPPGSGPRHALVVHDAARDLDLLVVTAELSAELLVAPLADVLAGAASWASAPTGTPSSSPGAERSYPSEVVAWGAGVAVGNRGPGTIGVLALDDGIPRLVAEHDAGGRWPQHLLTEAAGSLLIAQPEDDAIVRLAPDGRHETVATVPAPGWLEAR